jgi:putative transcriptional regulator
MIHYHPDARFLTDYAAGSLPTAQALCVATHLHYCAQCRQKVRELTELGSELFCQQAPVAVTSNDYERLLQRIATQPQPDATAQLIETPTAAVVSILPRALNKLTNGNVENLTWRKLGRNFRYSPLTVGDKQRETSLFFIKAGGSVPRHQHQGDEITVILQGSFSDQEGKYSVGDFVVRTKGEQHQPVASQDQDCLCLSTLDAPIVLRSWLLRAALRFMNWQQQHSTEYRRARWNG